MAGSNKGAHANDDALSIGDLLRAVDQMASKEPDEFAAAVATLSTEPGEKMLEAIRGIALRLAEGQSDHGAEEHWAAKAGGAVIRSSGTRTPHSSNRVSLTTLGDCLPAAEQEADRRPTFKVLRWHAVGGDRVELMPASALREAFFLCLSGTITVHADGAGARRLNGTDAAAAMWLGGVDAKPWLPRIDVTVDGAGVASGLLILLSETGVPVLEKQPTADVFRHGSDDLPVRLAPSKEAGDANAFWGALQRCGITAPGIFRIPRGARTARWCKTLLDVTEDPRDHYPHNNAVQDGLMRPKEFPIWKDIRDKMATEDWPMLMFRILELPALAAGIHAQLERHDGAEALLAWHGTFTFLTRNRGASPRRRMDVAMDCYEPAVECADACVHADGSHDILVLDSDHFHTIVAKDSAAVALHFTGSQVSWSSKWRGLVDEAALDNADRRRAAGDGSS